MSTKHSRRFWVFADREQKMALARNDRSDGWISSDRTQTARVATSPLITPSRSATTVVKAAGAATKAAGTAEFESITSSIVASTAISIGSVNFVDDNWILTTYQGPPGPSTETAEIRVIGPTTYERPVQPKLPGGGASAWMKTNRKIDTLAWVFAPLSNPRLTASYVGTSVVEDISTYIYDAHVPAATVGGTPVAPYEIRVWVDNEGRIREATTTGPSGGIGGITETLLISHFGVPVTVAAPNPLASNP